jgi:hypothetical protein
VKRGIFFGFARRGQGFRTVTNGNRKKSGPRPLAGLWKKMIPVETKLKAYPKGLKPSSVPPYCGTAEAVPFVEGGLIPLGQIRET